MVKLRRSMGLCAAGVLLTASRALADTELATERTRAKVREAATELRYVPHGSARALATPRTTSSASACRTG
jgi:DNA-binding LacI/PurR family transcriptional regulator